MATMQQTEQERLNAVKAKLRGGGLTSKDVSGQPQQPTSQLTPKQQVQRQELVNFASQMNKEGITDPSEIAKTYIATNTALGQSEQYPNYSDNFPAEDAQYLQAQKNVLGAQQNVEQATQQYQDYTATFKKKYNDELQKSIMTLQESSANPSYAIYLSSLGLDGDTINKLSLGRQKYVDNFVLGIKNKMQDDQAWAKSLSEIKQAAEKDYDLKTETLMKERTRLDEFNRSAPFDQMMKSLDMSIKNSQSEQEKLKLIKQQDEMRSLGYITGTGPENVINKISNFTIGQTPKTRDEKDLSFGECGAVMNDVLGIKGFFADTFEQKMTRKNKEVWEAPSVGDVFIANNGFKVRDANGNLVDSGHVGMIKSINADGTITIADSGKVRNKDGVGVWDERTMNLEDFLKNENVQGYYSLINDAKTGVRRDQESLDSNKTSGLAMQLLKGELGSGYENMYKTLKAGGDKTEADINAVFRRAEEIRSEMNAKSGEIAQVINQVPIQLKNAIQEKADWRLQAYDKLQKGLTPYEAGLEIAGWIVPDEAKSKISFNLLDSMRKSGDKTLDSSILQSISNFLSVGDNVSAMTTTENALYNVLKDREVKMRDSSARPTLLAVEEIRKTMEEMTSGPLAGRWNKILQKGLQNKNLTDFEAEVFNAYSEFKNRLYGSALTENEIKSLDAILPTANDTEETIKNKIDKFETSILRDVNETRRNAGLPALGNVNQLLNENLRLDVYQKDNKQYDAFLERKKSTPVDDVTIYQGATQQNTTNTVDQSFVDFYNSLGKQQQ